MKFKKTIVVLCQYFSFYLLIAFMFHFLFNFRFTLFCLSVCCVLVPSLLLKIDENELHLIDNHTSKTGCLYAKMSNLLSFPSAPFRDFLSALISYMTNDMMREVKVQEQDRGRRVIPPFTINISRSRWVYIFHTVHWPDEALAAKAASTALSYPQ